jgi:menaquinone-9 beta-reductase
MAENLFDIIVVGGGPAGLVASLELSRAGFKVALLEKKFYPSHKVCGEYLSNEVKPYLQSLGFNLDNMNLPHINKLIITGLSGHKLFSSKLPLGGFGISRYLLDETLYKITQKFGTEVFTNTRVKHIQFADDFFTVKTDNIIFSAPIVIGSYGKREVLDKELNRKFIKEKSPFMAVKYHLRADFPKGNIGLYNFKNGYCGVSSIEDDKLSVCYLTARKNMDNFRSIKEMEHEILFKNKALENIFKNADHLFDQPKVINEISFSLKSPVENHVLMCGDSAGFITPLCGNGMAMAIHAAKMLSTVIAENIKPSYHLSHLSRRRIEENYKAEWNNMFGRRIKWGKKLQYFFGNKFLTDSALVAGNLPGLKKFIIKQTHGVEVPC